MDELFESCIIEKKKSPLEIYNNTILYIVGIDPGVTSLGFSVVALIKDDTKNVLSYRIVHVDVWNLKHNQKKYKANSHQLFRYQSNQRILLDSDPVLKEIIEKKMKWVMTVENQVGCGLNVRQKKEEEMRRHGYFLPIMYCAALGGAAIEWAISRGAVYADYVSKTSGWIPRHLALKIKSQPKSKRSEIIIFDLIAKINDWHHESIRRKIIRFKAVKRKSAGDITDSVYKSIRWGVHNARLFI